MFKLPLNAQGDLRAAKSAGKAVFYKEGSTQLGGCPNCGGSGIFWFQFAQSGPHKNPPAAGKQAITYAENAWWVVESRTYNCPICNDQVQRLAMLYEQSGLEINERTWRVDFFKGRPGKEQAIATANAILAQSPHMVGWYVVTGDYGRGKSGLLKSLVASAILTSCSSLYTRSSDILATIRSSYNEDGPTEQEVIDKYAAYQLLAIDEIDRISSTPWAMNTLMSILDERYNKREIAATIIASNCQPEALPAGFEYLQSRMRDGLRVQLSGAELRGNE